MKLTRIQLAKLIGFIERNHAVNMTENQIENIDDIIDIEVPAQIEVYPKNENVEALMKHMAAGISKIDAIREHRAITGIGLKDSKDAVERYWNIKMSAETLKAKQIAALQRIIDDCSIDLPQFNEEEIQVIKRWIEGFSV